MTRDTVDELTVRAYAELLDGAPDATDTPCACTHPASLHHLTPDGRRTECNARVGARDICGCALYREAP